MDRLHTSYVNVSNCNLKCPIGKSIFALTFLPAKHFRATFANADTGNPKYFYTLFDTYLDNVLAKSERNRMVQNVQNFELLKKKS